MSSKNRTPGHKRFESDGKVSEIIDMYGDMRVSGHSSRNTGSGDKIDPKSSRGRNAPPVSTWSASTASTASDGDRTSRSKSKKVEVSVQPKGQAQEFEDRFFRPGSSVMRSPPRTPERRTSPASNNRMIQSPDDNTPTKTTKRQNTLRDLEGNGEKPLPLPPGSKRRVETAARALKDAQEEKKRQGRKDDDRQTEKDKLPREPASIKRQTDTRTSKPKEESEDQRRDRKRAEKKEQERLAAQNGSSSNTRRTDRSPNRDRSRRDEKKFF
ncbi:hypothetical protein OCU04_005426 [Sclerotinia nivalis]|uniref:Uncharacterized protein n=1 Tax=Sclerotinia nivalis TaxID=352851 RepID=A0A9X0APF6_9HELO|nr:hypothetical protein OCU04_005426 [Sclerotinia nivalis]